MTPRKYATPSAFKEALEVRLRARARELSTDIARVRQLVVFERFLARVASYFGTRAVVKGGVVLELRLGHVRATKDIDLAIGGRPDQILVELRRAGQLHLGDFLTFMVDLPDLALLALTGPFQSIALRDAIRATFNQRGTHSLPASIPLPPASWVAQYAVMAEQSGLQWATIADVVEAVRSFLEPILQGEDGEWDPASWSWQRLAGPC